jgi:3'-5' exoribonuclease
MPHTFIRDLKPGSKVNQYFLIKKKERRRTRGGKDYLDIILADRTGNLGAKIWSEALEQLDPLFEAGQFAGVAGKVDSYQDERQLTIERIKGTHLIPPEQLEASHFDPGLLVPSSPLDPLKLWDEILHWVESEIDPPALRTLTLNLLQTHKEAWIIRPAAKQYHHAYRGGLMEHTHRVVCLTRMTADIFPELNRGLLLAGAMLHDLGKIKEIEEGLTAQNSFEGQLLGHIVLGWEMVREAARTIGWDDPRLLTQLEHIVLAHHGQLEFGSPVLPQTREALVVHFLDDLEGKLKMMSDHLEQDQGEPDFTDWHRVLKRKLLKNKMPAPPNESESE